VVEALFEVGTPHEMQILASWSNQVFTMGEDWADRRMHEVVWWRPVRWATAREKWPNDALSVARACKILCLQD